MQMPEPDQGVIDSKADIVAALRAIVPGEGVVVDEEELRAYETDGLTAYHQLPMVVVLPETTAQVSEILKTCSDMGIKVEFNGSQNEITCFVTGKISGQ